MLLTITSTRPPATDLGYLLHKNPARYQTFSLNFGHAHVFYPEASPDRCTAALLLDVDPVGLVRGRQNPDLPLAQYVNDRPYVASSFLSVAISDVFRSAMAGRCKDKPDLPGERLPLKAKLAAIPCRGGEELLKRLFEPLGYQVTAEGHALDEQFPEWGESAHYSVELEATIRLADLLTHLYVLIPVLDDEKHYWVGDDEVEKLLRHGEGWLSAHPAKELIANRYLKHRKSLASAALMRLSEEDDPDPDERAVEHAQEEAAVEEKLNLDQRRLGTVLAVLKNSGAGTVLDLGCGEGKLLRLLADERQFDRITGLDISHRALEVAARRLHLDQFSPAESRIQLIQGALTYADRRLEGYDAAAVVEVIEHLDNARLSSFERAVFEVARPTTIVLTTPNIEYNALFPDLLAGKLRHRDHRFEWTRQEFQHWAQGVAERFEYSIRFLPVGDEDRTLGPPTQMGVFTLEG